MPDFNLKLGLILLACYLIGSFPTAFLLVKSYSKKDVTKEGSGNVGTFNAFTVSKSKLVGLLVLLVDFLKGSLPMLFIVLFGNLSVGGIYLAAIFLILGHNYNVWLKFKGGRGLATGAGIFIVINFIMVIGWGIAWLAASLFKKDILVSNFAATLCMPVFALAFRSVFMMTFLPEMGGHAGTNNYTYFIIFVLIITIIILSRHTEIIKDLSTKKKIEEK